MHRHPAGRARSARLVGSVAAAAAATIGAAVPAQAETVNVTAAGLAFSPASITVGLTGNEPGFPAPHAHVIWTMTDPGTEHTVTFEDPKLVSSGPLGAGKGHEAVIAVAGTYPYRCTIHPTMAGTVVVTPAQATTTPAAATPTGPTAAAPAPAATDDEQGGGAAAGPVIGVGVGLAAGAGLGWLIVRRRRAARSSAGG
jgi:plastocyanin